MNTHKIDGLLPDLALVAGSFGASIAASISCSDEATNLDSVFEACDSAGNALYGSAGNEYTLALAGTAVYADAEADMSGGCTNLDTVIDLSGDGTLGATGNTWSVCTLAAHASGGGAGVNIYDDTVNKIVYVVYEDGVSTVSDVETAIGAYGGKAAVGSAGTGANVLVAADDNATVAFEDGADQETISVSGNAVAICFNTAVSTVAEVEALVTALSGSDKIIKVKTSGTGSNVLTTADDAFTAVNLSGGTLAEDTKTGENFTVARTATGTYTVTLADRFNELVASIPGLQLATGSDKKVDVGSYDSSAQTVLIRVWDKSDTALADLSAATNNRLSFALLFRR